MSTAPTIAAIGQSTLVRKWRCDVDTNTNPAAPSWIPVRGRSDFKPSLDSKGQDDSDYEGNGWMSETQTSKSWGLEFKVGRKTGDGLTYDPGQEFLRLASDQFGPDATVHVRWYEVTDGGPTVEAYRGLASVSWSPDGGGMDALDMVAVKLTGQGERFPIDHPYGNTPAVPTITSLSSNAGLAAGLGQISIHGTQFTGATDVKFGVTSVGAGKYVIVNDSLIVATIPAHAAGLVDVTVVTPAGTSATSTASHYTYS